MPHTLIHVAVAIIVDAKQRVLVALRPDHVHQGGLWEFPGGKLESGESVEDALKRELQEELGIDVEQAEAFRKIQHTYPDKTVVLDIWKVSSFSGEPVGLEGQPVEWRSIDHLQPHHFPAANRCIIRALQLPDCFMISGDFSNQDDFLNRLEQSLKSGITLVQLRAKQLSKNSLTELTKKAHELCKRFKASLLINTDVSEFSTLSADGLHLSSDRLRSITQRPFGDELLLSASCHTVDDMLHAERIGADMILLSPVKETRSHPGVKGIGWQKFSEMIAHTGLPVYALGGMSADDLATAKLSGAQGVAAISSFWGQ